VKKLPDVGISGANLLLVVAVVVVVLDAFSVDVSAVWILIEGYFNGKAADAANGDAHARSSRKILHTD
jgi:hypothetical protein